MRAGERYMVRNETAGGESVDEGIATLVKSLGHEDYNSRQCWSVRFDDEAGIYARWIHPDDQESSA